MKLCSNTRLSLAVMSAGALAFIAGFTLLLVLGASGCSATVVPRPVAAASASFGDDGKANSGLLAVLPTGAVIDAGARDRFNALVEVYGGEFAPALHKDHGVTPTTMDGQNHRRIYFITNASLEMFILMSDWRREGRKPQ